MDKRWLFIVIILILAVCCGYFIASSSDNVGNAIADLNKSTVTLPHGFSVGETTPDSIELIKRNHPEKIFIQDLGKGDKALDEFKYELKSLSKNDNSEVISNSTNSTENFKSYTILYKYYKDDEVTNESISTVYTANHTFLVKLSGFNSNDEMNDYMNFVIKTIKPDYKKSQE